MMAVANMQMHQIAHMYLVNEILKQEPRSARLTGATGMMEVCSKCVLGEFGNIIG